MYRRFQLVLMVNHACNLRCAYCYTGHKFSRKMPEEIARRSIDRALASTEDGGILELGFFGGEPLIEAPMIASLIEYAHAHAAIRGIRTELNLTTNGTLASGAAWDVMMRADLSLAVSHDGLPAVHDRLRPMVDGRGSSATVEATLKRLIDAGREFCVVMVVRPDNLAELPAGIEYLRALGVRRIEPSLDLWTRWSRDDIHQLEIIVSRCARIWSAGLPVHSISWFDEKTAELMRIPKASETARCGFGDGQIAVAPSGNLYPCERLIGEDRADNPSRLSGHALEGSDFLNFAAAPHRSHEECDGCSMNSLCNTICRCSNLVRSGDVSKPDELLCVWNQACLTATARALAAMTPAEL
jgi:uncharacterized protein